MPKAFLILCNIQHYKVFKFKDIDKGTHQLRFKVKRKA